MLPYVHLPASTTSQIDSVARSRPHPTTLPLVIQPCFRSLQLYVPLVSATALHSCAPNLFPTAWPRQSTKSRFQAPKRATTCISHSPKFHGALYFVTALAVDTIHTFVITVSSCTRARVSCVTRVYHCINFIMEIKRVLSVSLVWAVSGAPRRCGNMLPASLAGIVAPHCVHREDTHSCIN